MKIAIGCDPNAEEAKYAIMDYIKQNNLGEIKDFGSPDVIYANVAIAVARAVVRGECDRGILLCGTGIGMSIAANKVKGAYAALIYDVYSAQRARLSNDANIACIGAFTTGEKVMEQLVKEFLTNEFVPGCSSQKKVDAYKEYDQKR
ncbi:MAG: RpiB/LacA/LacB family sugar-phosphate isomerase [Clostridiales bacterium]|nr:RpiB/LacA/LacB family sugar-phosphate isomerase [Clostridiales bacterium]